MLSRHMPPVLATAAGQARVGPDGNLIVRFLRDARRLNPPRPPLVPSWDLSVILTGLQRGPFELLDSVELKFLSAETALLTTLTSITSWIRAQGSHHAFRVQVLNLQALPSEEADPVLALLCPIRVLRIYVDRTWSFRSSEQLLSAMEVSRKERLSPSR
ncbi:hypothetical protein M9458_010774, partial [Cirrhinus mrigala]